MHYGCSSFSQYKHISYEHFFFHFLIIPQRVCGLTGKKKRHVIKMFVVVLRSAGTQVCFYFLFCVFSFSKKSSHDKKKHQWGHFIVLI